MWCSSRSRPRRWRQSANLGPSVAGAGVQRRSRRMHRLGDWLGTGRDPERSGATVEGPHKQWQRFILKAIGPTGTAGEVLRLRPSRHFAQDDRDLATNPFFMIWKSTPSTKNLLRGAGRQIRPRDRPRTRLQLRRACYSERRRSPAGGCCSRLMAKRPYWHEEKPGGGLEGVPPGVHPGAGRADGGGVQRAGGAEGRRSFGGYPSMQGIRMRIPARWPDERRLGGVVASRGAGGRVVRAGGVERPRRAEPRAGLFSISVARVACTTCGRRGASGVIAPDELRSVGLTNTPRLPDVPAWTNSEAPEPSFGN